jgi:hypothetical protein
MMKKYIISKFKNGFIFSKKIVLSMRKLTLGYSRSVAVIFFLVVIFHHFVKIFFPKNILSQTLFFFKSQKKKFKNKIIKNHHNCLEYKRLLKIFLFFYFEYCQIWLNMLMDHCLVRNTTKLKNKTLVQPHKLV